MELDEDVNECLVNNFLTVMSSDKFQKAITIFENNPYNCMFVMNANGKIEGLLPLDHLFRISNVKMAINKEIVKIPFLKKPNIKQLAEIFVDNGLDLIPLMDRHKKLVGVVSVRKLTLKLLESVEIRIESLIETQSEIIFEETSIDHLKSAFRNTHFDILPIFNKKAEKNIIGIVEKRHCAKYLIETESDTLGDLKGERKRITGNISNIMRTDYSNFLLNSNNIYNGTDMINFLLINKSSTVIVVNQKNEYQGLISLKNLVRNFMKNFLGKPGAYMLRILGAPDKDIEEIAYKKVQNLLERYYPLFGEKSKPEGNVRFKKIEYQSKAGMFSYETEIRVVFGKGKEGIFSVSATDWGAEKSLNKSFINFLGY